jgi:hypothetical protein
VSEHHDRDASIAAWRAEIDAMFERMQTPEFARAALKALNEPLRVAVPDHLRRPPKDARDPAP